MFVADHTMITVHRSYLVFYSPPHYHVSYRMRLSFSLTGFQLHSARQINYFSNKKILDSRNLVDIGNIAL